MLKIQTSWIEFTKETIEAPGFRKTEEEMRRTTYRKINQAENYLNHLRESKKKKRKRKAQKRPHELTGRGKNLN